MYVLGAYYSLLSLVLEHWRRVPVLLWTQFWRILTSLFSKLFLYMCGHFMKNVLLALKLLGCMVLFSLVIFNYIFIYSVCMWAHAIKCIWGSEYNSKKSIISTICVLEIKFGLSVWAASTFSYWGTLQALFSPFTIMIHKG